MGKVKEPIKLGDGTRTFGANGIFSIVSDYNLFDGDAVQLFNNPYSCLLYTSPSPRDA